VRTGATRQLPTEAWLQLRRIGSPLTGYIDGTSALEHCEALLASLAPNGPPRVQAAPEARPTAPKTVVRNRGRGIPKRPIFPDGSFVVAVGAVKGLPAYATSVIRDPEVPHAFRTRKAADRWWTEA